MSCVLPFPASDIDSPPGLLVHLSPELLQVLKASDATSTHPHRKTLPRVQGLPFSCLPSHRARCAIPTTPTARASENGHFCPRTFSLPSWRLLHELPLRSRCRVRVNNPQLAGGQNWGRWGHTGREGNEGPLSFLPLSSSSRSGTALGGEQGHPRCERTVTSETRRWRVSGQCDGQPVNQPELV